MFYRIQSRGLTQGIASIFNGVRAILIELYWCCLAELPSLVWALEVRWADSSRIGNQIYSPFKRMLTCKHQARMEMGVSRSDTCLLLILPSDGSQLKLRH